MSLAPGQRLDHYEILALLGVGGMGEVYRAKDTRLPREVAVKVANQDFNERFTREAKVIAALNHPNVCTLFDVGPNYLVMELVDGPTLEERIKEGSFSLEEAARVARQIADALDYAHDKGVVHRDLKPANIKIRPDGVVKVLDFGLAKATQPESSDNVATVTIGATQAGTILGTPAYMSPEQAKGKPADKRADIWAFGIVFYEMLSGGRPFGGATMQEALASVLRDEPDLNKVPAQVRRMLQRCLEKDPNQRLRHIGDVMSLVEETPRAIIQASAPPANAPQRWLWIASTAASLTAALAIGFVHFREQPRAIDPVLFQFSLPEGVAPTPGGVFSISPDGKRIVVAARDKEGPRLYLRSLDSAEVRALPGKAPGNPLPMFWSPDGRWLAYSFENSIWKLDMTGGPPQTLCTRCGSAGGAWSRDGVILAAAGSDGVFRFPASGGPPVQLTRPDAKTKQQHVYPILLPDEKHFLYTSFANADGSSGLYAGSIEVKPEEQESKKLLDVADATAWAPPIGSGPGHLLYLRDSTLVARPFDADKLEFVGEPVQIANGVGRAENFVWGHFAASENGTLVYRNGAAEMTMQLTWIDRTGKNLGTVGEPGRINGVVLSPDATRAAVTIANKGFPGGNIWIADLKTGARSRLTLEAGIAGQPSWSTDGTQIVYAAVRDSTSGFYRRASNGAGSEELIYKFEANSPQPAGTYWTPDGRRIVFHRGGGKSKMDIWTLPITSGAKPEAVLQTEYNEVAPRVSYDGRYVAYRSDESGRNEIYVRNAPGSSAPPGKWLISTNGGLSVRWRRDNREIFYIAPDGGMMSVEVGAGPSFQASPPKRLFDVPGSFRALYAVTTTPGLLVDAAPDGQRFMLAVPYEQQSEMPLNVVVGWQRALLK